MVRAQHANGGAIPKESQLENEGIACGTIYVGIQLCTKYSFFVKPTVVASYCETLRVLRNLNLLVSTRITLTTLVTLVSILLYL